MHLGDKTFVPGQGNNVYIFPAMGMATYATEAKRVTDEMFLVAAKALSEQVADANLAVGLIYPPQHDILKVSLSVASAVACFILEHGLAGVEAPEDLDAFIASKAYTPEYARRPRP